MATPDVRVRLTAEGVAEVVAALKKIQAEGQKVQASTAAGAKQSAGAFANLGTALGGVHGVLIKLGAAVSVGALLHFVRSAAAVADELGKVSQRIGASVENLSALRLAAETADVSLEALQVGLVKFAATTVAAERGSGDAAKAFKALGISAKEFDGLDTVERLDIVARAFGRLEDGPKKTALAVAVFGKQAGALLPLLNDLSEEGLARLTERARALGVLFSGETVAATDALGDDLTILKLQAQGLAAQFVTGLAPALHEALQGFSAAVGGSGEAADGIRRLGEAVGGLVRIAAAVGNAIIFVLQPVFTLVDLAARAVKAATELAARLTGAGPAAPIPAREAGGIEAPDIEDGKALDRLKKTSAEATALVQRFINAGLEAEGRRHDVTLTHLAEEAQKAIAAIKAIQNLSDADKANLIDAIDEAFAVQVAAVEVQRQRERFAREDAELAILRADIERRIADKIIDQKAGKQELLDLENARKEALGVIARLEVEAAIRSGNPDLIREARKRLEDLKRGTKEATDQTRTFAQKAGDAVESTLGDAFAAVGDRIRSVQDFMLSFFGSLFSALQRLAGEELAKKIVGAIPFFGGGGKVEGRATGGFVTGPGTGTSDSIPARLSHGEFVEPARVVRQPGVLPMLELLRRKALKPHQLAAIQRAIAGGTRHLPAPRARFAAGGLAGGRPGVAHPGMDAIHSMLSMRVAVPQVQVRAIRFAEGGLAGGSATPQRVEGTITLELSEDLKAGDMRTPEGQRLLIRTVAANPRAIRAAMGGRG